ncbi:dioxygenase [Nonomuraea sp. NPDC049646]|uniref:dioxygenase n=1 Tax=unclassified Nonomuraea TaxID=2593643 RepID=UPI00378B647C
MTDKLVRQVLDQVDAPDPRVGELVRALIAHLHAFVDEVRPTEAEWRAGLAFLAETGRWCTPDRDEFVLLSDMLGLTSAVEEVNHAGPENMTPSSVEGPFHSPAPGREPGAWISEGPERDLLAGDPYLGSDAAFAVKEELVRRPVPGARGWGMEGPYEEVEFDLRLVPLGWAPGR